MINEGYHRNFLLNLENQKASNSNKLFIKHHNDKYEGKIPIWVATEIMSFGMLSKLYSNMLPSDKKYEINKRTIFASIVAMKYLNSDNDLWEKFVSELQKLINEYDEVIELKLIGFPENWVSILL